ncbi:S-layer homology domain-containing protein [Paenibacillus sp. 1001270B_150601_E10]|uniref:S-layer homology domain-containing protein n=1 Tax=Paenibacillus sp. 1001270B_150601_E10 TaxID=2787079 RepID=UPI00189CE7DE|nr:S-layer homology domain-containing protein [Paenibacillus sp. 1001270B_150601_E10]
MTRKKLLLSILAFNLAFGTLTLFPSSFSSLGSSVNTAHAAESQEKTESAYSQLLAKKSKIYIELNESELKLLENVRRNISKIRSKDIESVWNRIAQLKKQHGPGYEDVTEPRVRKLIQVLLTFVYSKDNKVIDQINQDPELKNLLNKLAKLTGIPNGLQGISMNDALAFFEEIEAQLRKKIKSMELEDFLELATDSKAAKETISNILYAVKVTSKNPIAGIIQKLDLNDEDITNIIERIDPGNKASLAIIFAYAKSKTVVSYTIQYQGRVEIPHLSVLGKSIPPAVLNWKKISGSDKIRVENGKIILDSSVNTATAVIAATDKLFGRELYRTAITLTYKAKPDPIIIPTPAQIQGIVGRTLLEFADLDIKLEHANGWYRRSLLKQAQSTLERSVSRIARFNLSSFVKVEGNRASLELDVPQVTEALKKITVDVKTLKDNYEKLDRKVNTPKIEYSFDFGEVNASRIDLSLPKPVLAEAKALGVTHLALRVNGITVSLPLKAFEGDAVLQLTKQSSIPGLVHPLRSEAYQLDWLHDGKTIGLKQPIEARFHVLNVSDPALLTLAEHSRGHTVLQGGTYDAEQKTLNITAYAGSTVGAAEYQNQYTDIAPVQSWAGHAIDVTSAKGIFEGKGKGLFKPYDKLTHAEFIKLLVKTLDHKLDKGVVPYQEASGKDWYAPYLQSAVQSGLIEEKAKASFLPNVAITRAELAAIAAQAIHLLDVKPIEGNPLDELRKYKDANQIPIHLRASAAIAIQYGLITGKTKDRFEPNATTTRAEAAVILYRILTLK